MKKIITLILASVLALSAILTLAACDSSADAEKDPTVQFDGFKLEFHELDDGSLAIAQVYAETAEITLPAEHDGKAITRLNYACCKGQDKLKKLYVPDGVTYIGGALFLNCLNVEEISLPNTVTRIEGTAFNATGSISFKSINYRGSEEQWKAIEPVNMDHIVIGAGSVVNYNAPAK